MGALGTNPGLRERKKQKTRDTIIKAALELFDKRGYEHTTIAEIAEAAEVSPRTIFAYFPSKEDIVFCDFPEVQERLARTLRERPEGTTALDALRDFIAESLDANRDKARIKRVVASDETLVRQKRARFAPFEQLMVEAIAEDLHSGPDDIRPQMVAAALTAAFAAINDDNPHGPPEAMSPEHVLAVIDDMMLFLRGGLDALRRD
jgi:AcrR family transcriptional regulator